MSDLTGGHWITLDGEHVYIKGDRIVAGPSNLEGKTLAHAASEGKHVTAVHGAEKPMNSAPPGNDSADAKFEQLKRDGEGTYRVGDKTIHVEVKKQGGVRGYRFTDEQGNASGRGHQLMSPDAMKEWLADATPVARKVTALSRSTPFVLNADTADFRDAVVLGQGLPLDKDGVPLAYKWKESLPIGRYLDKDQKPFEVTPARVENLIRNFKAAKDNGFTPPILDQHEKRGSASMGFIVDARKGANGSLELLHQFCGDDAILASTRNKTSICTVANVTDEHGNTYDELVDHQALIPDPQLNNLSDFTPALAASRGQPQPAVYLSLAASEPRSTDMPLNPELVKSLRQRLGAADDVAETSLIEQAVAKLGETLPTLELSRTQAGTIATLTQERDTARTALAEKEAKVLELSKSSPAEPPFANVKIGKAFEKEIDDLFRNALISKNQLDTLKAEMKDGDKYDGLMLSRSEVEKSPLDLVIKVLRLNRGLGGTMTGGQVLPDPNNPGEKITEERKKQLLAHVGA